MRSAIEERSLECSNPFDSSAPIRLLVFSHNLDREGASISLKEMVSGLFRRGSITPELIAFKEGPLRAEYEAQGIPVTVIPNVLHEISTLKRLDREVSKLASRIQAARAEVILANTLLNFPAILAAEEAGVPSIWNPRESEPWGSYFRFLPDPVAQRAIAAIGLPRRVIFVAETTRAVWSDFEAMGNFTVIHNALNLERFTHFLAGDRDEERSALNWSDNEVVILCVGTICERKGQEDALLAVKEIAHKLAVPVRFVFVGDSSGSYARHQKRLASQLAERSGIRLNFISATTDIGRYYLAADAFLLCSRVESYPRVILEALAFGMPIISTPVFGVTEQLPDRNDAKFYEPGNVRKLGETLMEIANDAAVRQGLGRRAKARFAKMPSLDQMLSSYEEVIRQCRLSTQHHRNLASLR